MENTFAAPEVLIIGAGAIGQWLSADLTLSGTRVTLLVRPRQLEDLNKRGIPLQDGRVARPELVAEAEHLDGRHFDWVLLTVKTFQVRQALEQLRASSVAFELLVTIQNGLTSEVEACRVFPEKTLVAATTTRPVAWSETGQLLPSERGGVGFASMNGQPLPNSVSEPFKAAGIPVLVSQDPLALKWSKLTLNMVCNATCAILDRTPEKVIHDPELFQLEHQAVREALRVKNQLGLHLMNLPDYPVRMFNLVAWNLPSWILRPLVADRILGGRAGKPPSFLLDLRAARSDSEVRALNGAIADQAERMGLPAPVNRALTDILVELVERPSEWEAFRDRPQVLLAEIDRRSKM